MMSRGSIISDFRWRLGVVSYLNARPLVAGLDRRGDISLTYDVPARLPELLRGGTVDAALIPVIDLFRDDQLRLISNACIGCDGETLTVRVFSRIAASQIRVLYVDGDSHTSVALAKVLWLEEFGIELELRSLTLQDWATADAILLIGDKVVTHRPRTLETETDLGQMWKRKTGLPFVFAVWAAPANISDPEELTILLESARDLGVRSADMIAADIGPNMGWPVVMARRYLGNRLTFTLDFRHNQGLVRFHDLLQRHNLAPSPKDLVTT